MKTTVEISDELFIEAKKKAAELRRPLRELIEGGLRLELHRLERREQNRKRIRWVTVEGGLPKETDLSDRQEMSEWLVRERQK